MASKLVFAALAFVCFVAVTNALKCHQCTYSSIDGTESGTDCNDEFTADKSQECGSGVKYCYKGKGEAEMDGKKMKSVVRMCGGTCTKVGSMDIEGGDGEAYCCEGDNCNSAGAIVPTIGVLLASLILTRGF